MRCLWLENGRVAYRKDVALPRLATGEALLQLRVAGICATDLELTRGYYPFTGIPGHEFVAEVLEDFTSESPVTLKQVLDADRTARIMAMETVKQLRRK